MKEITESTVDIGLERRRYVYQTEWHYQVLKMAVTCSEGGHPFASRFDAYSVVGVSQVQLGVDLCIC